jgi:CheY-like chemotaxis protein
MKRVLVIDDDKFICVAIETSLHRHDCEVVVADSGYVGTKTFETSDFDVVMVDIFMPGMDGLEIIKEFRKRAPTLPIVAMSGYRFRNSMNSAPDFLEMAVKLGATYRLRKPFGQWQLRAAINACLVEKPPSDCAVSP